MSYKLRFEPEAVIDIQQAYEWYEEQKKELGDFFIDALEEVFQKICDFPQYYTPINSSFRRIKVYKFPYVVIYEIEHESIIINAVRHTSRRPKQ